MTVGSASPYLHSSERAQTDSGSSGALEFRHWIIAGLCVCTDEQLMHSTHYMIQGLNGYIITAANNKNSSTNDVRIGREKNRIDPLNALYRAICLQRFFHIWNMVIRLLWLLFLQANFAARAKIRREPCKEKRHRNAGLMADAAFRWLSDMSTSRTGRYRWGIAGPTAEKLLRDSSWEIPAIVESQRLSLMELACFLDVSYPGRTWKGSAVRGAAVHSFTLRLESNNCGARSAFWPDILISTSELAQRKKCRTRLYFLSPIGVRVPDLYILCITSCDEWLGYLHTKGDGKRLLQ